MKIRHRYIFFALLTFIGVCLAWWVFAIIRTPRNQSFYAWVNGNQATRAALTIVSQEACPGFPFIVPAGGYIGLLYGDPRIPYSSFNPHQGIDIFSNNEPGLTPIYAAYNGYITRETGWKSTLIQRVPNDPLQPGRQIWLYYTHIADSEGNDFIEPAFPAGTSEFFVSQGTLLGYTGNYSGDPSRPVGVHLHFSIVLDDGDGHYRNELELENTLDPSPYLGLPVNYACAPPIISQCTTNPTCP